jgi:hypothetical protein
MKDGCYYWHHGTGEAIILRAKSIVLNSDPNLSSIFVGHQGLSLEGLVLLFLTLGERI